MTGTDASPLVGTDWLAAHLGDPAVRIAEVRTEPASLQDPDPGRIPGALSWFWKDLFWDALSREFATPEQVAERLSAYGVPDDATLVLYSARVQFAVYGYWVLAHLCGRPGTKVLDGGWAKWLAEGRPVTTEPATWQAADCRAARAARDDSTRVRRDDVLSRLGRRGTVIVDARSAEEYAGLRVRPAPGFDHGAERAGHIPGAVHMPTSDLLAPDGSFRPRSELEAIFRRAGAAPDQADEVIAYCRLGHRASAAWFASSQLLGWRHLRIYDGSWTEWGSCVAMPIEREEPARAH